MASSKQLDAENTMFVNHLRELQSLLDGDQALLLNELASLSSLLLDLESADELLLRDLLGTLNAKLDARLLEVDSLETLLPLLPTDLRDSQELRDLLKRLTGQQLASLLALESHMRELRPLLRLLRVLESEQVTAEASAGEGSLL